MPSTLKQDEHGGLRGLSRRSVIPYVHGESCCIAVRCSSLGLNLPKRVCLFLLSVRPFFSPRSDSYTVTHGPTGGPRVAEPLYRS
jgi:hypothetical protein